MLPHHVLLVTLFTMHAVFRWLFLLHVLTQRCVSSFCWGGASKPRQSLSSISSRTVPDICQAKPTPLPTTRRRKNFEIRTAPNDNDDLSWKSVASKLSSTIWNQPQSAIKFSVIMTICGALLGPFLDSYHSAFGVLQYDQPLKQILWGSEAYPALTTAWWVPELFGLAGFLIGWLYILGDAILSPSSIDAGYDKDNSDDKTNPSIPVIFLGISLFTFQYWLSGVLSAMQVDRSLIFIVMSSVAAVGFGTLDGTMVGLITSMATALGGPLIEVGLLSTLTRHGGGYHYNDSGETGFFPLWIVPVYFLGGPAVGNLARGFWNGFVASPPLQQQDAKTPTPRPNCPVCNDTRGVGCPNCEGIGTYVTYGRLVKCNCCKGRGFVICRNCFSAYKEDPNDIEAVRRIMSSMPD